MGPPQGRPDGQTQGRRGGDGRRRVEEGGGDFQGEQQGRCGKGQAAHQHVVIEQGLGEVEQVIGQAANQ